MQLALRNILDRFSPWQFSLTLHSAIVFIALILVFARPSTEKIEIMVLEDPGPGSSAAPPKEIARPKPKVEPVKQAVFGATRDTLTSDSEQAETVKLGNTLAVAPDDKKLKDDDPDALPIPADEYTVSAMPSLKAEYRIPYPPEAKKKGIQGPVVMDILIDAKGRVREVQVVEGPDASLINAASEAVKKFEFQPARIGDQLVAVRIRYAYRFVLEK